MKKRKQIITGILVVYFILCTAAIAATILNKKEAKPDIKVINQEETSNSGQKENISGETPVQPPQKTEPEAAVSENTVSMNESALSKETEASDPPAVSENQSLQEEASPKEPEPAEDKIYCRSITKRRVNIRETPQMDGKVVGKIEYGKIGTIEEEDKDGWTKVTFGDATGYCSSELLEIVPKEEISGNTVSE